MRWRESIRGLSHDGRGYPVLSARALGRSLCHDVPACAGRAKGTALVWGVRKAIGKNMEVAECQNQ